MATAGVPLWSTTAASNATADPAVNWAEGMAPSAVNDSARAMMASVAKWRDDLYGITSGLSTGGSSTAYIVTTNATYATAAVMSGAIFTIIPHTTSGAAPTLAVDGLTARALNVSTGVAVPTGALISGTSYMVRYVHGSTEFVVLNPSIRPNTALDIINGTSLTTIAVDDTLPIYDLSATANKRILISDVLKVINLLTGDSTPDGAADYVMTYDASATAAKKVLLSDLPGRLPRGYIDGCILANGADATNDITVTAGVCRDSTNTVDINVPAFSTGKQLDANWAAGDAAGMRNSAAGITDTTYHIWAVRTAATAAADIYAHTSTTAATVLTALQAETGGSAYAFLRHIGSIVRISAAIRAFKQKKNGRIIWGAPVSETVSPNFDATQRNFALSVPTGIDGLEVDCAVAGGHTSDIVAFVTGHPDQTLAQPANAATPTNPVDISRVGTNGMIGTVRTNRVVDASAQIAVRASITCDVSKIYVFGFTHPRGRDA